MNALDLFRRLGAFAAAARPEAAHAASWAWAHRTLVLAVAVVVLLALQVRSCRRADTAEASATSATARADDEARAEAAGIPVAREVAQAQVDDQRKAMVRDDPAQLVARIQTEPGPAAVPIAQGEQLRLGADLIVAETSTGAHIAEGTLEARRAADGALVLRQPHSARVTVLRQPRSEYPPDPPERRWRLGPVGGATGYGWVVGAGGTYRLDLWGWRPELLATAAGGPGGVALLAGIAF